MLITVLNAVVGLRQEGKAESAMNALKAMVKATARVRRDGTEAEIPAEEIVVGDVVLLAAGDEVPADGRIVEASSLQIDESALTGESDPAAKEAEALEGADLAPGDQTNMAFMHTPVTHGSGVVVVTATGGDTEVGKIAGMLAATAKEKTPLTRQLDTLTLWIAAAAGVTMIIMFVLGAQRGQSRDDAVHQRGRAGDRGDPGGACRPCSRWSSRSARRARQARRGRQGPDVGRDARLDVGDQLGQDRDADDEPGDGRRGARPDRPLHDLRQRLRASRARSSHAAGSSDTIDDAILPYVVANDAKLVDGKVVGDPTEGALLVLAHKAGLDIEATRERLAARWRRCRSTRPTSSWPPSPAHGRAGKDVVRCFVKGAAPAVMSHAATALAGGAEHPWDDDSSSRPRRT